MSIKLSSKAQVWIWEFIFALFLFMVCFAIFYAVFPNLRLDARDNFEEVALDAKSIANKAFLQGSPIGWDADNVSLPGLIDGAQNFSDKKIMSFYNLSKDNYTHLRIMFGVSSDFMIYFADIHGKSVAVGNITSLGNLDAGVELGTSRNNISIQDPNNLVAYERIGLYKKEPLKMVVIAWD